MKLHSSVLASFLMLSSCISFADVAVYYGEGPGKVDFINAKKYPNIQEPLPFGPLSFRMVEDKVWVTDSVGGKLMQFNQKGKLVSEFSLLPKGAKPYKLEYGSPTSNILVEDFAPVKGAYGDVVAWWIADSQGNKLVKFSVDGKKLAEVTHPEFCQLFRVEVGMGGHLFVADKAASAIFVFDPQGKFLRKYSWEWTGMAVAGTDEKLYRLVFDREAGKHHLVATDLEGKTVSATQLDVENMFNSNLWWVDENSGEAVITYTPATGFNGTYYIVRVGLDGAIKASGNLKAPFVMNRFIDNLDYSEVFIGKANYEEAPNGKLEITPFKMPDKK